MEEQFLYRKYSAFLKEKYGEKVYKLPVSLPVTCPNRDGTLGYGGCIFCGEKGGGHESLANTLPVSQQLMTNMAYIRKKYKANKFIAYFQNFSNTYLPVDAFSRYLEEACLKDIVEISISTRPDCITADHLQALEEVKKRHSVEVSMELGLQTVNYHTLKILNRGHTLAEFIHGLLEIHRYSIPVCVHMILDLPWDDREDVVEGAKILSALKVEQVKLHALYIVKDTPLAQLVEQNRIDRTSADEYMERVILFLEHLDPDIVVQRLIGRVPEQDSLTANWNQSWWKIRDGIEKRMLDRESYQGKKHSDLGGKVFSHLKLYGK